MIVSTELQIAKTSLIVIITLTAAVLAQTNIVNIVSIIRFGVLDLKCLMLI